MSGKKGTRYGFSPGQHQVAWTAGVAVRGFSSFNRVRRGSRRTVMKKYRGKGRRNFNTALHYNSLQYDGEKRRGPQRRRSALRTLTANTRSPSGQETRTTKAAVRATCSALKPGNVLSILIPLADYFGEEDPSEQNFSPCRSPPICIASSQSGVNHEESETFLYLPSPFANFRPRCS